MISVCVCLFVLALVFMCVCVFFSVQGTGGLYQCDYPAAHDSEYKETLVTTP